MDGGVEEDGVKEAMLVREAPMVGEREVLVVRERAALSVGRGKERERE